MKRKTALATAMTMAMLLASCSGPAGSTSDGSSPENAGSDFPPAEKQVLQMLTWGDPINSEKIRDGVFEAYPELAEKMDLEFIVAGASNLDVAEKYRLSLTSNSYLCDILMFNSPDFVEFAEAGTLMNLDDIYTDEIREVIFDSVTDVCSYGGEMLAVPQEVKQALWFYNKTMFDEAGIDPSAISTVDEFISAGKQFMEKFPDTAFFHALPSSSAETVQNAIAHNKGVYADADGNYIINQDPGVRQALEDIHAIFNAGIHVEIANWTPEWEAGFKDRVMASTLTESWFKTFGADLIKDSEDEWSVALWPAFGGSGEAIGTGSGGGLILAVPQSAANPDLAKEYLQKTFLEEEGRRVLNEISKLAPIRDDMFQEILDVPDPDWGEAYHPVVYEALKTAGMPSYVGPQYAKENTITSEYFNSYMNDEMSLDEMLEKCNQDLVQQIGSAK